MALEAVRDPYGRAGPEPSAGIPVDRVRELNHVFAYGSFEGAHRSAVLLDADRMRAQAANALLKTLEEPPPDTLIVLTAPSPEAVLPTVVSRCQRLKFPPVAGADVAAALLARGLCDQGTARRLGESCGGNVRRALAEAGGDAEDVQGRAFRFLQALAGGPEPATYAAIEQLAGDKARAFEVLRASELWLRQVLRYRELGPAAVPAGERGKGVRALAGCYDADRIERTAEAMEAVRERSVRNVNLHLGLVDLWRRVRDGAPAPLA